MGIQEAEIAPPPHRKTRGLPLWVKVLIAGAILAVITVVFLETTPGPYPYVKRAASLSNLKQIGIAAIMYSEDHDDRFQPSKDWEESIFPYCKNRDLFTDPLSQPDFKNRRGYAMNWAASEIKTTEVESPAKTPLFFTSTVDTVSAVGGKTILRFDKKEGALVGAVDGSAKQIRPEAASSLIWEFQK